MKALVYNGPRDVSVTNVPDPTIERPTDVLVKITTTNICGSDLHMYDGSTDVEQGKALGHENLGAVVEAGAVQRVKVGDRVCLPFNVACGYCQNCARGLTRFCLTANPGSAGATYGYADMGPYQGGQAEYLRVPWADFNCLVLPPDAQEDAQEKEADYVMLVDIFPTAWHATELARVQPGDSVVVYGAGPVGILAAYSATIKGASKVMVVDRHPDRLALAAKIGAIPIDDSKGSPVEQVLAQTDGQAASAWASRRMIHRVPSTPTWRSTTWCNRCARPADSASSASTCPRTPGAPTRWPSRARSRSTSASSGSRARAWARGSATPRPTTSS